MPEQKLLPDTDGRDKRKGNMRATGEILSGNAGRKVFFGMWLFIMTNIWLGMGKLAGEGGKYFMWLSFACMLLIGFGTILDTFFKDLAGKIVEILGEWLKSRGAAAGSILQKTTTLAKETTLQQQTTTETPAKPDEGAQS